MKKKKGLILDFTSLLDVILILLFMVIVNMGQVSHTANQQTEHALKEAVAQAAAYQASLNEAEAQLQGYEALAKEHQQLQNDYALLQDEYDYLKITSDFDETDISVYRAAIERMSKAVLILDTETDPASGNPAVTADIYLNTQADGTGSYMGSFRLLHDFSLTKEERERYSAQQVLEVTRTLSGALRGQEHEMVWFSIQYAYDDENISNSDLTIIKEAIHNLERNFSISCYVGEMKLF